MTNVISAPTLDDALTALKNQIAKREERQEKNLIFCEDRLTLLAERAVLGHAGGTFLTEVSTFSRFLSNARRTISKQGSVMVISQILEEGEALTCFSKSSAQAVYETIAQLAASRVDATMLRESALGAEGLLRLKLTDLATLLEKYTAYLNERGLLDENGYLALLPEKISSGVLKDTNVFFFAFPSFTAQAREGIRAAIEHAKSVTGIFISGEEELYTREAERDFSKICGEYEQPVITSAPCTLGEEARILRGGLFSPDRLRGKPQKTQKIRIFVAEDEAQEMDAVCALIKKRLSNNLRYRDMAVLVEGSGKFAAAEKAFKAYNIPFFSDRKRAFSSHPFCAFALSALSAVASGGLPDSVDAVASSVYFGGGDNYRNYLLKFGGYRGAYKKEIKDGETVKGYNREELTACREKMIAFLSLIPAKGEGRAYTAALRSLFALSRAEEITEELKLHFENAEREFLDLAPFEGVLAEIEELAGGQRFTAREFFVLLQNGLSALEISMIPQSADAIFVGDMTESRLKRVKVLFCTGLTDALPRTSSDTAVITDGDMQKLSQLAVTVEPAIEVVNARARESFALNLCAFEDALYLSRPLRAGNDETEPSEALSYVKKLFTLPTEQIELFPYNCSEELPAKLQLYALKEDFERGRAYDKSKFSTLSAFIKEQGVNDFPASQNKENVPAAGELYFAREISPTLLESYFACPYSGFMMRGLRLREREERSVLDTDTGSFVHAVLEKTAAQFNAFESEEGCRAAATAVARELLLSPRFAILGDTRAGTYTGERLVRESAEVTVAAYAQVAGSSFRVAQTEGTVTIPALSIRGTADRIDEANGYVRVIDYKTGEIDDKTGSYYTGRRLQLQLYLLAASREGKAAGAFYFPAHDDFTSPDEEKFRMKGFFSKDEEVLALMDNARVAGEKSKFFEGGGKRGEKGMSGEEFSHFLDYALLVSAQAEREMRAGNIAPSPYGNACSYCKCKGMCAFSSTPRKENKITPKGIVKIVRREKGEEV